MSVHFTFTIFYLGTISLRFQAKDSLFHYKEILTNLTMGYKISVDKLQSAELAQFGMDGDAIFLILLFLSRIIHDRFAARKQLVSMLFSYKQYLTTTISVQQYFFLSIKSDYIRISLLLDNKKLIEKNQPLSKFQEVNFNDI